MSRKGIGDRVKAKTNVATVRLASALGFQVGFLQEWGYGEFYFTSILFLKIERDPSHSHINMRVNGFEPDVFRQLMEFAHTGRVDLQPRTIIGVICAADHYEFTGSRNTLYCNPLLPYLELVLNNFTSF